MAKVVKNAVRSDLKDNDQTEADRNTMMNPPVSSKALCGLLNLRPIFANTLGKSRSRLSGTRDLAAVMIPALAVVRNARRAATLRATLPGVPMKTLAPSEIGVSEPLRVLLSSTPTVTKIIRV